MASPISNYFDDGLTFFEAAEYEPAIEMFTKALRLSLGDLAETHLYRGIAYAYLNAFDKAMDDFNAALRKDGYLADAYNERGNLYRLRDQYDLAIQDYDAAIMIDSAHYAAHYNRALAYETQGQLVAADDDLTIAIQGDSEIAIYYEARGRIRNKLRRYQAAIADYERYLQLGGGYDYDNHSEVRSLIIALRFNHLLSRVIPKQFIPIARL